MSYPRNNASPERIAVGAVVQISDGAVQTSGVSVSVRGQGGASGAAAGTIAYDNGIVQYTPTQGETDFTSFVVVAYKAGCIPASVTVVTSAASVPGKVDVGAISGDSTAADNLETMLDGTGTATLSLRSIVVSNSSGTAVVFQGGGVGAHGFVCTAGTSGQGIYATGGSSAGSGMHLLSLSQDAGLSISPDPLVSTSGTATAGGASTISLQANAVSATDYYKDQAIVLTGGTGAGQTNRITGQTALVCTVETPWVTQPDSTTVYKVLGRVE